MPRGELAYVRVDVEELALASPIAAGATGTGGWLRLTCPRRAMSAAERHSWRMRPPALFKPAAGHAFEAERILVVIFLAIAIAVGSG